MGDDHELRVVAASLLTDGSDGHAVLGERLRDGREHTRFVVDVDRDVIARTSPADVEDLGLRVRRLRGPAYALQTVPGDAHQVAHDRTRRRRAACTGTVAHQLTGRIAHDAPGVEEIRRT